MDYDEAMKDRFKYAVDTLSVKHLAPEVYEVLKRLEWVEYLKEQKGGIVHHWKWRPRVGEWCFNKHLNNKPELIVAVDSKREESLHIDTYIWVNPDFQIPILEWEVIEGVLEKAGYVIEFIRNDTSELRAYILSDFKQRDILNADYCKSRLLAVYKAVIALGKELKC